MSEAFEIERIPKPDDFVPEPVFPPGHAKAGKPRCKAWNGRQGRQCANSPLVGRDICYQHGGAAPTGLASPNLKTGRYSKYLPKGLLDPYQSGLEDTELVSLRDEISILDARTGELMSKIDLGESHEVWRRLQSSMRAFDRFNRIASRLSDDDPERQVYLARAAEELGQVRQLIDRGIGDWAIWSEIKSNMSLRKILAEGERRRLVDLQQMITSDQAKLLVRALMSSVLKNVTDRKQLTLIQSEFVRILDRANVGDAGTENGS